MDQQTINSLIEKYKERSASPSEIDALHAWYRETGYTDAAYPDEEALVRDRIQNRLIASINPIKKQRLWARVAVAAAAVAAIVVGVWFYSSKYQDTSIKTGSIASVNDIGPGKNGATIMLPGGQVIALSDAKSGVVVGQVIKYNDGTAVGDAGNALSSGVNSREAGQDGPGGKPGEGMMLTASTAKGQTYQFTLPDGTKVWLNADSKISFPSQFSGKQRKILLSGEGYFEVVHNARQPFKVESKGQVVEDIGTAFNISAYSDEGNTKTTLVEGSARVNEQVLKPNQQALLTSSRALSVKEINAANEVLWKEGKFSFKSEQLSSIMRKISRWYDVQVVFKTDVGDIVVSGSVSRFAELSTLLTKLEQTGGITFKIEGRRVYVSR